MKITITYKAFSNETNNRPITSATIEINGMFVEPNRYEQLCDLLFQETNLQQGSLWNKLQPVLPANRTHTSLSVGDEITINNNTYLCSDFGWELLESVETK
jgi:hypothetical protein